MRPKEGLGLPCDGFEDFLAPAALAPLPLPLPLPVPLPPELLPLLKLAAALAATELPAPKATRVGAANNQKNKVSHCLDHWIKMPNKC
jgi:hypothetical protein